MQMRCVPEDEYAVSSDGKRLPFAILTADERRKPVEETGPFGKSRRGRSRTKHSVAAKKEDPHIAYFAEALKYDLGKSGPKDQSPPKASRSRSTSQSNVYTLKSGGASSAADASAAPAASAPSLHIQKEPTEVILYGYKSTLQPAAIDHFEKLSFGHICEDYARDSPTGFSRFRTIATFPGARVLTPEERLKVNTFAGGEHWIKVTFDSSQAADRVVEASPQQIKGYLVYAELYRGLPPSRDAPIPAVEESSGRMGLSEPRPLGDEVAQGPSTLLPASSLATTANGGRRASTLPRSFTTFSAPANHNESTSSLSSSTVSSATVTGYAVSTAPRNGSYRGAALPETAEAEVEVCRVIPTARRIKLRPAEEAVLPRRSTYEIIWSYVPFGSFFRDPKLVDQIPKTEDGRFDYAKASLYWRVCLWLDRVFQTDLCGLKDE